MQLKKERKPPFSELHHIGLIVRDLNKTIKTLSSIGIGPFEPAPMKDLSDREFRGKRVRASSDVWFAKLGHTNLELVQPLEGESLQKETLERKGEGVEHLGFFVDNLREEVDRLVQKGWKVLASARGPQGGGWAFLQAESSGGIYIELVQPWE
jgi:catechol 2,3-dioxygenase-like lactoylglutathione lyase family enzyme